MHIVSALGVSPARVLRDIDSWLEEDAGGGDVTVWTQCPQSARMRWEIIAKQDFTLCGLFLMAAVVHRVHGASPCLVKSKFEDGSLVRKGDVVVFGEGHAAALLLAERVSLNLAARLSGVASKTNQMRSFVESAAAHSGARPPCLLETRKTTPGLRLYEKYATRVGGARNHRHALDTGLMLKENHLRSFGGIEAALASAVKHAPVLTRVEVEVSNLKEFDEALNGGADVVMLDNFALSDVRSAVERRNASGRAVALEVSGNLTEENIGAVAQMGVEFVSSGALVHQATWVDMSMQLYPLEQG
jgi:nicotinate-nucleotide pyrophosphorylase (carboxylating)